MIIKRVSFINYKKFKEPTEVSFEEFAGRIGILGNNGSGKSSLLDVIPIALYGVDAITGKKEHLRTQGVTKDAVKLRLEFEHTGKNFIIEREFRGANLTPKAALFELVEEVPHMIAQNAKETNESIEKVLGMDYSTFVATVFCKQKELNKIAAMQPTERRAFILKLSKVDDIDNEIKKCRELKRDSDRYVNLLMSDVTSKDTIIKDIENLENEIKIMKSEHKGALKKLTTKEEKAKEASEVKKEYDEKYEVYNELALELKDCQNKIDNIKRDKERLTNEEKELLTLQDYVSTEGQKIIDEASEVKNKLDSLDQIRPKYTEKMQLASSINKVKQEGSTSKATAEDLYKKAGALGFEKGKGKELEEEIVALEKSIDELKSVKNTKDAEAQNLRVKGNEVKNEIKKIKDLYESNSTDGEDCKCPMCKQAVSKEYSEIVEKHYRNELEEISKVYSSLVEEINEINKNLSEKVENLNGLKTNLRKFRELEISYNDIVSQYNAAKQVYTDKVEEYKALTAQYQRLSDINFNEEEYNETKTKVKEYEDKLRKVHIAQDKVKRLSVIKEEILCCDNKNEEFTANYNEIITKGKALNFNKAEYVSVKEKCEKAIKAYNDVREETAILMNQIHAKDVTERKFLNDKLDSVRKKEKDYNKHKELSKDFNVIEEALINTKTEIMTKINPLINKHFSDIFKTLMNEKYDDVELDDNYNIVIYDCGEAFPISRFSGGEQDLCNLALRLAVSKFLTEITSGNIEFVVLDEIFASLDDDRKSALIEVLGNLKEFFKQIFIISHEDVIKSALDFYLTVKENEYRYSEIE